VHGTFSDNSRDAICTILSKVQRDVATTNTMVSKIHHAMEKDPEGCGLLVSETSVLLISV